ncbi:MAG: diguanylate cyclase [Syntrophomonadaceae bacterium]|nr:diguanylate cyclase [Syntrophomonadaceae bacterium]
MGIELPTPIPLDDFNLNAKIYDMIRVVDPFAKKVLSQPKTVGTMYPVQAGDCFALWKNKRTCDNCVSMRALNQNRTVVKIAYDKTKVYLAIAVPIEVGNARLVVEFIKDVTRDGFVDLEGREIGEIEKLIRQRDGSVIRDALARIYNQNYIYERLRVDIDISREQNRPLALFFLKLTDFERINDLHGRQAGDHIIKTFANIVKRCCRKDADWSARYSGLEFIYVSFDMDEKKAHRKCKYFCDRIANTEFSYGGRPIEVLFVSGFHIIKGESITPDEFIQAAGSNIHKEQDDPADRKMEVSRGDLVQKYLLTSREKEVALLLLEGLGNRQIAAQLYIGLPTVKKHVSHILDKVQVKSRTELLTKVKGIS